MNVCKQNVPSNSSQPAQHPASPRQKLWGMFARRERWGFSRRGWLVFGGLSVSGAMIYLFQIQPFLAPTQQVDTKFLVVEGWIRDFAVRDAAKVFHDGRYEKVYTTGGPVTGTDGATNIFNTLASVAGERLIRAGVPAELVQMVPAHSVGRDRTYTSAIALRDWFREHHMNVTAINVVSEDVHARRTWLLFQRAFGDNVKVGIIAIADPDYEPKRWWRYSEGVREILGESIAYGYAKFIFSPGKPPEQVP